MTFGETMALMRPTSVGPLSHVSNLGLSIGGAESNVAIGLNRLGTSVTWIGRVGDDSLGDLVLRELAAEGISTVAIRDPGAPTGLMVKETRTATASRVWYYRSGSAGSRLEAADLPDESIRKARALHVTGITPALSQSAATATLHAIDVAREAGTLVSFDLNYRAALWSPEAARGMYRQIVEKADVVFAGDDEAAILVGPAPTSLEYAVRLAALGPSQAIIKSGADGCTAIIDGASHAKPAVETAVIDTVGAGDGFVAGYLAELLNGRPAEERLSTAVLVGAFACTVPGDWEGAPKRRELAILEASEPVIR
ncbi:sugar kinase [Sinomonas cellulolyticus]|uniref:Sugar kinase n=1 Tax=Sinomonas cellulolyticus TaxID=2801916 RepID=A0ABS1JYA5_9MICC|nr:MULTISPECIES: sugar kinase [Sinomonas]MBL0704002.1 sugar kinase [Sinomonas cellulolyticus]